MAARGGCRGYMPTAHGAQSQPRGQDKAKEDGCAQWGWRMVLGGCPRAVQQHLLSPAFTWRLQSSKHYRDSHPHAEEKRGARRRQEAPGLLRGHGGGGQVSPLAEGAAGWTRLRQQHPGIPRMGMEAPPAAPRRVQGGVQTEPVVPRRDQPSAPAIASLGTTVSDLSSPQHQEHRLHLPR